jgi:hypothetical protein
MGNSELGIRNLRFVGYLCLSVFLCGSTAVADPTPTPTQLSATITVIPNPARGKKLAFRIVTTAPAIVRVRIYNRFFDPVEKLEQEGNGLFDILWSLKKVPEGIYYYQTQVEDKVTGQTIKLPQQKFVVLKEEPAKKKKPKKAPTPSIS